MAFNSASGYNNLPTGNFAPEIFSQKVLKFFRRASVAEDITNTDYTGEIENFGDTVNIMKEPTLTVSAYSRGSVVNPQDLADDQITLTVDQANAGMKEIFRILVLREISDLMQTLQLILRL